MPECPVIATLRCCVAQDADAALERALSLISRTHSSYHLGRIATAVVVVDGPDAIVVRRALSCCSPVRGMWTSGDASVFVRAV
jgi:hypothetical protein